MGSTETEQKAGMKEKVGPKLEDDTKDCAGADGRSGTHEFKDDGNGLQGDGFEILDGAALRETLEKAKSEGKEIRTMVGVPAGTGVLFLKGSNRGKDWVAVAGMETDEFGQVQYMNHQQLDEIMFFILMTNIELVDSQTGESVVFDRERAIAIAEDEDKKKEEEHVVDDDCQCEDCRHGRAMDSIN